MKLPLVFALVFFSWLTTSAQDSLRKKKIIYKMDLQEITKTYKYGYLVNITDVGYLSLLQERNKYIAIKKKAVSCSCIFMLHNFKAGIVVNSFN